MISVDDYSPSDPSSSHNHLQKQDHHDLKISDIDLKFLDVDLDDINNNQLPKFSIRDYVSGLRSKYIASNWPFSSKSLQLCLKHGVKNMLPPFESLESLRNNSSLTNCSLETRLTDEELIINSSNGKPRNDQFNFKPKEKLALKSLNGQRSTEKPSSSSQKPENTSCHVKKSRFVTKFKPGVEQRVEDNTFETMASKICPVCKTFSSSSNTTLNAHIDQCLTGDQGSMKWNDDHHNPKVIVKHKVKPRKMRLMLDIYKTAPYCTIEELDRRNGTSWANNSSFPAQEFQFHEENNDPKTTRINRMVADNEGDVYIDTNGTKVRILSVPKIGTLDNNGARKLVKGDKIKQKHQHKYLNVRPNPNKLCSPKPKAKSGHEEDVMPENCNKNEHGKEPMKVNDLGITRPPWACSKRTVFSKKFIDKYREVELPTKDLVTKSDKSSQNRKKMETSSLIKQPLKRMHDDDDDNDDDDDACPSQHSDDVDTRSKCKKLSSLSKNLSFPARKLNLKRKFSSVEKSWVESVDWSSQDSLKEQSRTEENTISKTNNQDSRSISSKSISNEESSVKFDELHDVESVRTDTLLPTSSIPTPSFIGLNTAFELYDQDPICSTNRDVEKHENYNFQDVDLIPIPGPPGSFLPASPGGEMVSEEQIIQETRVVSTDQDSMSNSPVSTVSNSRSTSVQDDAYKRSFFNNDTTVTVKGQSRNSFKNDQPCCCSRKEVALNNQDSYILRKQSVETASFPTCSPSKPVLRLMGKDLTLVKSDEEECRPPQLSQQPPQWPVIFSQRQNGLESQDMRRSLVDSRPIYDSFMVPLDRCGLGGAYMEQNMLRPHHQAASGRNVYNNAASSSKPYKEIIIIDDSPENEGDDSMRNEFLKRNQGQMNPLYSHPHGGGSGGSTTVFRGGGGGSQTFMANGDLGKWNMRSSQLSSMSNFRSSKVYYTPSYP